MELFPVRLWTQYYFDECNVAASRGQSPGSFPVKGQPDNSIRLTLNFQLFLIILKFYKFPKNAYRIMVGKPQ